MRNFPKLRYSGLTIVLSNPSRYDTTHLISAFAGTYFDEECLQPTTNKYCCDIRTSDTFAEGLLPDTRGILLLGERSFKEWTDPGRYSKYNLNEQRGCEIKAREPYSKITTVASFSPQDAVDFQNFEERLNESARASSYLFHSEDTKDSDEKHKGNTARSNYRFWLKRDTKKILALMSGTFPFYAPSTYHLYPNSDSIINLLSNTRNQTLYLDIETDNDFNILCFSFSFDLIDIYCVPCLSYNYSCAYSCLGHIFRALCLAMNRNTVCCYNCLFDLLIIAWKYKLPVGKLIYDPMLTHHRCWPEVEKSLGHAMSHLTHEPYHKDLGIFSHGTKESEMQLLQYNGYDIRGMYIVKQELDKYSRTIPGLVESIEQVNASVRPDLINSLMGIKINTEKRKKIIEENDALMMQYLRIILILTGGIEVLPTSNKSCVNYFHNLLGYPVVARSRTISKKTGEPTNNPSLNEKAMLQLKLKAADKPELYDNPIIDLCLAYRGLSIQTGWLRFIDFPVEGRCSTNWKISGTETFRKSSTKLFGIWGQNLQNPTSRACEIFESD